MKIIYYGGRQAGMISLLTLIATGHEIVCVIPINEPVELVAQEFNLVIKKPENINEDDFVDYLETLRADVFVCCHGRQIIKSRILNMCPALNVHPCLYKYPGADPITRLLVDKNTRASVGVHRMTEEVDAGEVLIEDFKQIKSNTVVGVYNELYPLYSTTLIKALRMIASQCRKDFLVRPVNKDDCVRVWEIKNHPMVRANSKHQEEVVFADHKLWFDKKYFSGANNYCYVLESKDGKIIGYCRFDYKEEDDAFIISIALDPEYHARGFGFILLNESLSQFGYKHDKNILAEIKKDNIPSIKLFKKNNFKVHNEDDCNYYLSLCR